MMFSNTLILWYLQNKRNLPWRKTNNPYFIWLSEIILQQTRVAQGLTYYIKFIEAFPTIYHLAKAQENNVLKMWQGLGYYSRARNLHSTAKHIVQEYNGQFPKTFKEIKNLKGIGDYTASAITSICYNLPHAVVDGNVYRVLSRYFNILTPINTTAAFKEFKALAQQLIDPAQPGTFNQAIMDFGATICKPQNPLCPSCPFSGSCLALKNKTIKTLPVKDKKLKIKKRYFNFLVVITEHQKTVIVQRKEKGIWQNLYQFPLIEFSKIVSSDELIESKEFRLIFPEKVTLSLFNKTTVIHKLSHQHLYTQFWIIRTSIKTNTTTPWNQIKKYPVPVLISNFLNNFDPKNY